MVNKSRQIFLRKSSEYSHVKNSGRTKRVSSWLLVGYVRTEFDCDRYGWVVPARIGPAVTRNKIKRWCRVLVRELLKDREKSDGSRCKRDVVFIFRSPGKDFFKEVSFKEFYGVCRSAIESLPK